MDQPFLSLSLSLSLTYTHTQTQTSSQRGSLSSALSLSPFPVIDERKERERGEEEAFSNTPFNVTLEERESVL